MAKSKFKIGDYFICNHEEYCFAGKIIKIEKAKTEDFITEGEYVNYFIAIPIVNKKCSSLDYFVTNSIFYRDSTKIKSPKNLEILYGSK